LDPERLNADVEGASLIGVPKAGVPVFEVCTAGEGEAILDWGSTDMGSEERECERPMPLPLRVWGIPRIASA
jgi:hypothetical protein